MSKKQVSDIIRDKVVRGREHKDRKIVLTDEEACDIWSALVDVESDLYWLKHDTLEVLKEKLTRLERSLDLAKKKVKI
jgi:hypothetical protein